jgi:uncharacterized protein (TIGR02391 family)
MSCMATPIPAFPDEHLRKLCAELGDTAGGLTGTEIGKLLASMNVDDPEPAITKKNRLYAALATRQARDRCGNVVVAFIVRAMAPVSYVGSSDVFHRRRTALNEILAFCGYFLREDGKLQRATIAKTLDEAEQRAGRLRTELRRRGVHADVVLFCRAELIQNNYFHAVFEATKSVAEKIRQRSGLHSDGSELVDQAFGMGSGVPILAFNSLRSPTEKSEHTGLMNLMKGTFGAFRNVTAHAPKVTWPIEEQDALDLLTIASLLHRRLDAAFVAARPAQSSP